MFLWQGEKVNYEKFKNWLLQNKEAFTFSRWLLSGGVCVTLTDDSDTPTFYQTLAGVTHCKWHCPVLAGQTSGCSTDILTNSLNLFLTLQCTNMNVSKRDKRTAVFVCVVHMLTTLELSWLDCGISPTVCINEALCF